MSVSLTREQVRRVDQYAIERYGLSGLVLMENAGRNVAQVIRKEWGDSSHAVVFCGVGNNGGDGFVIARHVHNAGWSVRLVLAGDPSRMTPDTKTNHDIARAMGLAITVAPDAPSQLRAATSIAPNDVVVDALLGTGFQGNVREPTATLIHAVNDAKKRALIGIDLPSGLDCDSGEPSNATIRAHLTVTFVAEKAGFGNPEASSYLGRVVVVDIGSPRELLDEILEGR